MPSANVETLVNRCHDITLHCYNLIAFADVTTLSSDVATLITDVVTFFNRCRNSELGIPLFSTDVATLLN